MKKIAESTRNMLYGATIAYTANDFSSLINPKTNASGLSLKGIVLSIVNYSLFFLGVIAVAMIVYGGVLYVTSGGDSDKTTKARNTLMYAVLGIIVIVMAFAIIRWATGVNPANLEGSA